MEGCTPPRTDQDYVENTTTYDPTLGVGDAARSLRSRLLLQEGLRLPPE